MLVRVANDIIIEEPTREILEYCRDVLTIDNPDYITAERLGRWVGNMPKDLKMYAKVGNELHIPFGCLTDVWARAKGSRYKNEIHDFIGSNLVGNIKLYDYQQVALEALKQGKNGILEAPCGSGKTQIGLALIKAIGGRALWLTHTKKLLEQSKGRCETYFKGGFGEITDGEVNIGKDITFATVQTMSKVSPDLYKNAFDIVIVDECHHCVGTYTKTMQFYKVVTSCNARYKYGLSATLDRSDNMIETLYSIIGKVLHTIPKSAVGNKIIKADYKPVFIDLKYNEEEMINADGTINYMSLLSVLSSSKERNKIIVSNVFDEYQKGKKQLVLCHRVKQVEELSKEISKFAKVNCITGKIADKNREYDGDVIVATYSLAKEGLDIPELNVLHLATPQKNKSSTEQSVGRIERNVEGKQTPVCYDYVDTSIRYCLGCYKKRKSIILKKSKNIL